MPNYRVEKTIVRMYDLLWRVAITLLRKNNRLAEGFAHRTLERPRLADSDLWIQSASAGEAFLAWEILKRIPVEKSLKIMLTSNTRQGIGILEQAVQDPAVTCRGLLTRVAYFPFDRPVIAQKAVRLIQPAVTVLLETELWPGLIHALKSSGSRVLIINGRITPQSLSRYLYWPSLWHHLSPVHILAISRDDADRFARLFPGSRVDVMPNIKFDRLDGGRSDSPIQHRLDGFLPLRKNFMVMGSVRQEEERPVTQMIATIFQKRPQTVIGLFPRHMHRIPHWREALEHTRIPWLLRSGITGRVPDGTVILWDVFGELGPAYRNSSAAFVGGSLARLGGQNFLEPLISGVTPVIGPSWENFKWVGREIIDSGLVKQAGTWKEVANILVGVIMDPLPPDTVRQHAGAYIKGRQGGTEIACRLIARYLSAG